MTRHARRAPTGGRAAVRLLAAGAIVVIGVVGCSIENDYALLSFFFDGVPAPGTGRPGGPAAVGPGGRPAPPVVVSSHSAYTERRCEACHGDTGGFGLVVTGFSDLDATVCQNCHSQVAEEFPRMHGPVTAQECLWCHWPHNSPYPHLLAQASPDLCLGCHGFELRGLPQPPEHQDLERDCLECHHGHGGQEAGLLRPWEASPPVSAESESTPSGIEPKEAGETDVD